MSEPKQVIVVRKDLKMRKGKIAAQAAHASMKIFFDRFTFGAPSYLHGPEDSDDWFVQGHITDKMAEWARGIFKKICLGINSEEELLEKLQMAKDAYIPCCLITDNGLTEFHGVPTNTCIAIGPDDPDKIDAITGELKPL